MALQFSTTLRNNMLDVIETTIGLAPIMKLRTGTAPATCGTADSGTVVSTITLPSDWANAASGGTKTLLGTWQDLTADAGGTVLHFRVYDSGGSTCIMQGTVGLGSGDLSLDNNVVEAGQKITITAFTLTAPGV